MAAISSTKASTDSTYRWHGRDRAGKTIRGEMQAPNEAFVKTALRRQGIKIVEVSKARKEFKFSFGGSVSEKDVALFTRQLATMLKAGVPLIKAFDIVSDGASNPEVAKLLRQIKSDIETGMSLKQAFEKHPLKFDSLFCGLIGAAEAAGILDSLLERLATHQEKILAIKSKIKAALFYPITVLMIALIVVLGMLLFVVPKFQAIFKSSGRALPAPTQLLVDCSQFFLNNWIFILGATSFGIWLFFWTWKRSQTMQQNMDHFLLHIPIFGAMFKKSAVSRWCRTLATMFTAGLPLVEALNSVASAAGNHVYFTATKTIQSEVSTGAGLSLSMQATGVFPNMVIQMALIGEESGSLDDMLGKCADFYEAEVDDMVKSMSSLMEPLLITLLGVIIGSIIIAMYLPIFQMAG